MKLYLSKEDEEYEVYIEGWETWDSDNGWDDLDGYALDEDNEEMDDDFFYEILQENVNIVEKKLNEAQDEWDEQYKIEARLYYDQY